MEFRAIDWVRNHVATTTLISFICVWYGVQLVSVPLFDLGSSHVYYWFYATTTPSPAWFFAPFSHQFPPGVGHIASNLAGLLFFGAYAESHLGTREFAAFAVGAGYLTLFIQFPYASLMYTQPVSNAGFSGALFALLAFYSFHTLRQHEAEMELRDEWSDYHQLWGLIKWVFATLGILLIFAFTALQFVSVIPAGNTSVATHFFGLLIGALYEYARPGFRRYDCLSG